MELKKFTDIMFEYYQSIILIAIITILLYLKPRKNLPPGPWGLPIVGYLPFLKQPPYKAVTKLGEKYGNVISFYFGNILVIVLGDYNVIKEAFVKQGNIFSGKPNFNPFRFTKTAKGLMVAEGETANQHRRFILSCFKDFGMGKTSLEPQIMEEIKCFLDEIRKENGKPMDLRHSLHASISNVIAMFEFGKRFGYSDKEFSRSIKIITNTGQFLGAMTRQTFLPWIKYIPLPGMTAAFQTLNSRILMTNFFSEKLQQNENNYVEGSRTHYIDAFLTERNSIIKKTGSEANFSKEELLANLRVLFAAGTDTTTAVLLWSVLYFLKYPEMGIRVLQEINDVIGQNRDPTFNDKTNMPYTDAFMLEVHRHSSLLPFSLVHGNMEETTLNGYTIPKGSYIVGNLWAVHHDKNLWENPDEFNPERFINEHGKVEKPEYLIPFSIGKRNCIGEALANTTYFLYFTTLLQHFEIKLPEGKTVSMENQLGIIRLPEPFNIRMITK